MFFLLFEFFIISFLSKQKFNFLCFLKNNFFVKIVDCLKLLPTKCKRTNRANDTGNILRSGLSDETNAVTTSLLFFDLILNFDVEILSFVIVGVKALALELESIIIVAILKFVQL